ncbi:hypothetical protein PE067_08340 [Paracoccus sp. DMF-8]|uniref:hypothetical protein n=1 Tax=Paracoccus sp. DMF-8 TaxID=3019445 RepID=UPI0023E75547|nr:hypothetical protein [Paracoccus sp. DMF-8]MDF3606135.1 hypothetical protein [Paracoccus sp. DMF-8]
MGLFELQNIGGTANDITAEVYSVLSGVDVGVTGLAKVILSPNGTNTGPVTLSIAGDAVRDVFRDRGQPLEPGDLSPNAPLLLRRFQGAWRISGLVRSDIAGKADAANSGPIFATRQLAVDAGQAALAPAIGRIVTIEGSSIVYRGPGSTTDALFSTYPQWGVATRVDTAAAIRNSRVLPLVNIAGTGDAITAELHQSILDAGVTALSALSEVEYIPAQTNAAANPKITIAGVEYDIRGPNGEAWPAQGFVTGRSYKLRRRNSVLRVSTGDVTMAETNAEAALRASGDRAVAADAGVINLVNVAGTPDAITADFAAGAGTQSFTAGRLVRIVPVTDATIASATLTVAGVTRTIRDTDLSAFTAPVLKAGRTYVFETYGSQFLRLFAYPKTRAEDLVDQAAGRDYVDTKLTILEDAPSYADGSRALMRFGGRDIMRMYPDGPRLSGLGGSGGWDQAGDRGIMAMDQFETVDGVRYPVAVVNGAARRAIIISVYGQSNADCTEMDDPLLWVLPPMPNHIFTLNDVSGPRGGLRGWLGVAAPTGVKRLVPAHADAWSAITLQTYSTAAAARLGALLGAPYPVFACRSSAVGGNKLVGNTAGAGIWKDSTGAYVQSWNNWTADLKYMHDLLTARGYEVDAVHICFTHQEADWQTPRASYSADLLEMMADREALIETDMPGMPVRWFCDQASGSGLRSGSYLGGAWPSRLAVVDAVEARANATMVMPRYHMRFGINNGSLEDIHHAYYDRILQGETYAHAMREVMEGREWSCPQMVGGAVDGNSITVEFDSLTPIRLDPSFCKVRQDMGFKVGDGSITVQSVTQTGQRQITLQCSASPAGQTLAYAWRQQDAQDVSDVWPISTGAVRDAFEAPSLFLSGERIIRAALGGTIQL